MMGKRSVDHGSSHSLSYTNTHTHTHRDTHTATKTYSQSGPSRQETCRDSEAERVLIHLQTHTFSEEKTGLAWNTKTHTHYTDCKLWSTLTFLLLSTLLCLSVLFQGRRSIVHALPYTPPHHQHACKNTSSFHVMLLSSQRREEWKEERKKVCLKRNKKTPSPNTHSHVLQQQLHDETREHVYLWFQVEAARQESWHDTRETSVASASITICSTSVSEQVSNNFFNCAFKKTEVLNHTRLFPKVISVDFWSCLYWKGGWLKL